LTYKKTADDLKGRIERELERFMKEETDLSLDDPLVRDIMDALTEYTLREAKRVRAILAVIGYQAVGGRDLEKAVRASISLELVQSMLLIHDDIIDSSPERRGGPSFHAYYAKLHRSAGYGGIPDRFGTNMAIIGGDLAESLAEKALLSAGFPPERTISALVRQTEMVRDTGFGQVLDLYSESLPEWTEEMVAKVQEFKTARYTLEGPLLIGASLHGASDSQMKALSDYAIPVGIAFQIIDDILGFYGDPKRGGKKDRADIIEGKRTLLIMKALELCSSTDRIRIRSALGNKRLTIREAEAVREIVRRSGSEEYSRKMAEELSDRGIAALEGSDLRKEQVKFLREFAKYLLGRT